MNIFQDPTKSVPKSDNMIVRVDMEQLDIGGRKSHLPAGQKSSDMSITHVASSGPVSSGS
jgi:hypothetical protein